MSGSKTPVSTGNEYMNFDQNNRALLTTSIGSIQMRLDTEEEEAVVSSTINQLK